MTSTDARSSAPGSDVDAGIEPVRLIRGASRGFSVLAIGGVVQPLVGYLYEPLGYIWLVLVAISAFVVAAWQSDATPAPLVQGAASAVAAYVLMVPLVLMGAGSIPWYQATLTTVTAVAVGASTAAARKRVNDRRPKG